jgi:hypothetical protein
MADTERAMRGWRVGWLTPAFMQMLDFDFDALVVKVNESPIHLQGTMDQLEPWCDRSRRTHGGPWQV